MSDRHPVTPESLASWRAGMKTALRIFGAVVVIVLPLASSADLYLGMADAYDDAFLILYGLVGLTAIIRGIWKS